jgi:hypothetical protein
MGATGKLIEQRYWLKFDKEEFGREIYKITGYMLGGSDFDGLIKECRSKNVSFVIDFSTRELIVQRY